MAIPDGGPLSTVGQKRGHKNMERTTGPSLMGEIFEISAKKEYRHYFYGSKEETLELLYQKLTSNYPGIQIAGMYSPPFRPMTEEEDKAIIERINETKPDFVWVGLGAPKQEKWMATHQGKIDGLMLGVGAGFDECVNKMLKNIELSPLAETWECSTHPDGVSTVRCGTFDKMELTAVIKAHPEYLGERHKGETTLPILVKLIDARSLMC